MLNIIIYEDDHYYMQKNINGVNKALINLDLDYRIHKFDSYNEELKNVINNKEMKKIYILDVETKDISGIEIASMIREEDFDSVIIFATAYKKYQNDVFYSRLMALDFIHKYNGYENRLIDDIKAALKIIFKERTFTFKYNHILHRIHLKNILYIEKEPIIKRRIIHTTNDDYYIMESIERLKEKLGESFFKTHQSCIVNLDNIKEIDFGNNTIIFKNNVQTNLLTNKVKKELQQNVYTN